MNPKVSNFLKVFVSVVKYIPLRDNIIIEVKK